jgi:hypothetical protein
MPKPRANTSVASRDGKRKVVASAKKPARGVQSAAGLAAKETGAAIGSSTASRAKDAGRVIEAIERTHTKQVGQAASRSKAVREVAAKVKAAADRAAVEGGRSGGMEQLKGHFVEILDVDTYNAKNRLTGKKLIPRSKGNAEAYDATRIVKKRFAGGVQQKASASHVEKTIRAMEKKKPGSAKKGVLRVPKDQVEAARRKAGPRVKEVKGMEFTRQEATIRLDKGVGDVAHTGTTAASQMRALGKAGLTGATVSIVIGGLADIPALRRGDLNRRDYGENRAVDAAEGATGAMLGTGVATLGAAGTTAALGTAGGVSFAASAGAAGTAVVGAIGGMGSAGAAVAGILGGVTVTAALPVVAGATVAIGSGVVVGKGFKRVRRTVKARQGRRRLLTSQEHRAELTKASGESIVDATVVELTLRGRADFTVEQAHTIRESLYSMAQNPGSAAKATARLRRLGFYISDWTTRGVQFTVVHFDELIAIGFISIRPDTEV